MQATLLDLGDLALGLGADRQIKESLSPVDSGDLRRTINGALTSLVDPAFRKFKLSVSCDDMHTPGFASAWKGRQLTVRPSSDLTDLIAVGGISRTLERDPVAGSVRAVDVDGATVAFTVAGRVVTLGAAAAKTTRLFYRPVLVMLVASWSTDQDEAGATTSWQLELEEV